MLGATRRVCVTGAAGRAGRVVVRDLLDHGYDVIRTDLTVAAFDARAGMVQADLTDYGQVTEVLRGSEAVVHLAAVPAPGRVTPAVTFTTNVTMDFNVFHVAASLGLSRVVWASSEAALGLSAGGTREADAEAPRYAPVDEDHHPAPATTYALSKVASETIAGQLARWSGIPFIGLRFSSVLDKADYERISLLWPDSDARKWNLWSYVDARDMAAACRLALEADVTGSQSFNIAAADTVMRRPSAQLLARAFPGVPLTRDIGEFETLVAIDRARKVLGYSPRYSWRQY